MHAILSRLNLLVNLAYIAIIAHWLVALGAVKTEHPTVQKFKAFMDKALDPVYSRIRKFVQPVNGWDLTPLVALIGLGVAHWLVQWVLMLAV